MHDGTETSVQVVAALDTLLTLHLQQTEVEEHCWGGRCVSHLLHAHKEAVVHAGAILLGALAQVVVQHLCVWLQANLDSSLHNTGLAHKDFSNIDRTRTDSGAPHMHRLRCE